MTFRRAVVVGAGLSGLMAARTLASRGWSVVVLDKGRGVGGRMATRRITTPDGRTAILD
ncbi:MAG: FAD-dependent oxidoreductase, partial [Actinomycetes bacterium]